MKNYLRQGTDYKNAKNGFNIYVGTQLVGLWHIVVFFDPINMGLDTIFLVIFDTVEKL